MYGTYMYYAGIYIYKLVRISTILFRCVLLATCSNIFKWFTYMSAMCDVNLIQLSSHTQIRAEFDIKQFSLFLLGDSSKATYYGPCCQLMSFNICKIIKRVSYAITAYSLYHVPRHRLHHKTLYFMILLHEIRIKVL